jgi:MFS superfamily sulfate permease-like transporter
VCLQAWLRVDEGRTWCFLAHFCLTLVLMLLLPKMGRVGRLVPASLVAIVVGTAVEWYAPFHFSDD